MSFTREQAQERITELREYSERTSNMVPEARAQWLESCLECDDQYLHRDLDDLERDGDYWAESSADDWGYCNVYPHWYESEELIYEDEDGHWRGSGYEWIVWAVAGDDISEFHDLMHQYCLSHDLPVPQWYTEEYLED